MSPFRDAILMLARQSNAIFLGQGVAADGIATYADFEGVPLSQRIEFPVAEELNVGAAIGLALTGYLPIVCIPRIDFLLRAMDQLVNHLDKLEIMSNGQFNPKVIIRTRVGAKTPLYAGPQHTNDHTAALKLMLTNVVVCKIEDAAGIMSAYGAALARQGSTLIIEALPC